MPGPGLPCYEHFLLYETRARFYLVAYTSDKRAWRVLKISRTEATEVDASEDTAELSERQAAALLRTIADGNAHVGGLQLAARACGVAGVIRFLEGYYLILVTQRRRVGTLAGHAVYAIDDTEARAAVPPAAGLRSGLTDSCAPTQVIPLTHSSVRVPLSADEQAAEK
jgi:phosphatidylinositol 3,5-bisphosphate 5-phosphatase